MTEPDAVHALLSARGCPPHIVEAGLSGLVDLWEGIVQSVEAGYSLTLDDYLNDMDVRDLIAAAQEVTSAPEAQSMSALLTSVDARLLAQTAPSACLWGNDIAEMDGLDPVDEWWYFRRPTHPGDALREDLEAWGLL